MKKKLIYLISLLILVAMSLTACGELGTKKKTYKYEEKTVYNNTEITKTVYYENGVKIYYKSDRISSETEFIFYDEEFNKIEEGIEYKLEDEFILVTGANATKVSGMYIEFGYADIYKVRYLDSEQFASLAIVPATDIEYVTEGDKEAYYTQEELDEQQARIDAKEALILEALGLVEGKWKTEDGAKELHFFKEQAEEKEYSYIRVIEEVEGSDTPITYSNCIYQAEITYEEGDTGSCIVFYYIDGALQGMTSITFFSDDEIEHNGDIYIRYE